MKKTVIIIIASFFALVLGLCFMTGGDSSSSEASTGSVLDINSIDKDFIVDTTKCDTNLVINDVETLKKAFKGYSASQKLVDNAQSFLDYQKTYNVNAIFAAAVSIDETTAGTKGHAVDGKNNWFNIKIPGTNTYQTYGSESTESIKAFYELISNNYFTHTPTVQNTVATIGTDPDLGEDGHSYCEHADAEGGWTDKVVGYMKQMYEAAGIQVSSGSDSNIDSSIESSDVKEIMNWSDSQAWKAITGTAYSSKPTASQVSESTMDKRMKIITVKIRTGKNSSKNQNMNVNKAIAPLWEAFFKDLYEQCEDFYIVTYDGAYVYRDVTGGGKLSAHAFGCAIDLNAKINGNRYGQRPYTKSDRDKLTDNKIKNSTIYFDSPMLKIAHKYTIVNGADWSNPNDAMHFSFIGDWTRQKAKSKFGK